MVITILSCVASTLMTFLSSTAGSLACTRGAVLPLCALAVVVAVPLTAGQST